MYVYVLTDDESFTSCKNDYCLTRFYSPWMKPADLEEECNLLFEAKAA